MSLGSEKRRRMELEAGEEEDIQSLINHTEMAGLCPRAVEGKLLKDLYKGVTVDLHFERLI